MDPTDPTDPPARNPESEDIPGSLDGVKISEHGLDESDISLIREKLKLTPTQRLHAAQTLVNTALRIRAENG